VAGSSVDASRRTARLPDLADEVGFAYPTLPESRLQTTSRRIAITLLLTSAALGTVMRFVTKAGVLS
jgi:hypothetical protein